MPTLTNRLPKHWRIESNNPNIYSVAIDESVRYKDKPAVLISSEKAGYDDYLHLNQPMDGNVWYGKRVRISCFVKTANVGRNSGLSVFIQAPAGHYVVSDPMLDRGLMADNDWQEIQVVMDVPHDGRWMTFGPILRTSGKLWVSQIKVEEVPKTVPRTDDNGAGFQYPAAPVNLDFSQVSEVSSEQKDSAVPASWSWPRENDCFNYSVLGEAFDGSNVAVIQSNKNLDAAAALDPTGKDSTGYLCQSFSAKPFRGSRVKFSSFIKTENIEEEAVLVLMVNGIDVRLELSRMDPLMGDNDWTEHSLVLNVSEFAYSITIWLQMKGRGKASFAKVSVEEVSDDVPCTDGNHHPKNLDFCE